MQSTAPPPSTPTADADAAAGTRLAVASEVLRLSTRSTGALQGVQFLLNAGVAALFGWLYSVPAALAWLALVAGVSVMRAFFPQRLSALDSEAALRRAQRVHMGRTALFEAAHGSAGVLLFDASQSMHQLLLGLIVMGMTLSSAFSTSFHTRTVQLALVLLMLPVITMGLLFGAPPMMAVAGLGALLLALMVRQVASHTQLIAENIGLRLGAHALREQAVGALHESQQAQAARLRFFSAANHDLRQPVMAMGLQSTVLREQLQHGAPLPDLQRTVASLAEAQAALEVLTHQLLEIGRIEAAAETLAPCAVPLAALLHEVAQQAGASRVHVRCPPDAVAWSDPLTLRRMLGNLTDNARKFAPEGRILLACRRRADGWRLEVRDGGVGIAPELHERVFEDFEQVGNAERNLRRGHGLGLAIVRRLASRLGLAVSLRSAPGRGSVFAFVVPAAPADAQACTETEMGRGAEAEAEAGGLTPSAATPSQPLPLSAAPARTRLPRPLKVLVVEDNAVVADSLAALLRHWGAEPHCHASAASALARVDLQMMDIALCDIRLPGAMDGVALAAELQRQQPTLRVALVSADLDVAVVDQARRQGWAALRKPVEPAQLFAVLSASQDAAAQT
ncbi:MAG: hybrid sensor histidine kinase/response regulator [Comamonadaceae bacterium]|nr:MAG: hybrid sensor histidine kinase/response regulator [Comamonadaceae bacterium]